MLMVFRLLVLSVVLFSSGVVVGWWLHYRYPAPDTRSPDSSEFMIGSLIEPFEFDAGTVSTNHYSDLKDFSQALEDVRTDDALTIYQRHERIDSRLTANLLDALTDQIHQWKAAHNYEAVSAVLERFTEYYYQDLHLLRALAENYETVKQPDKAIEV